MAKRDVLTDKLRRRLELLRDRAGLTNTGLARASGQVQQEVDRFFKGDKKFPSLDFLNSLAGVFHHTVADLIAEDVPAPSLTKEQQDFIALWKGLTPAQRDAFAGMMRGPKKQQQRSRAQ